MHKIVQVCLLLTSVESCLICKNIHHHHKSWLNRFPSRMAPIFQNLRLGGQKTRDSGFNIGAIGGSNHQRKKGSGWIHIATHSLVGCTTSDPSDLLFCPFLIPFCPSPACALLHVFPSQLGPPKGVLAPPWGALDSAGHAVSTFYL